SEEGGIASKEVGEMESGNKGSVSDRASGTKEESSSDTRNDDPVEASSSKRRKQ
ncbi:hypothetical protein HAX54_003141, partial [Datura stramonium]|nr:hypothetical protein [Datura stramonium]